MENKFVLEVGSIIQSANQIQSHPGYICIENGRITAIGTGTYEQTDVLGVSPAVIIRRPNAVAIPGLVNAHGHASMTLLRGAGDDMALQDWLNQRIFPLEDKLTNDAVYWGTMLAVWEMLKSGTTTFTDMYMFMNDAARAVEETGMRAVLSWGAVGFTPEVRQKGIADTRFMVSNWHNQADGRITVTAGPHAPYTCPPDYLEVFVDLCTELNIPIQIHLSETKLEVEESIAAWGKTPIEHAFSCGLMTRPLLAAHCVHATVADIERMKQFDVKVAHNPQSNLKLASGIAPIVQMKNRGLTVGLGTDGAASNNNLDMFEELRLAATLHKGVSLDPTVIPAPTAFEMATADSAKCCFLEPGHGTLTVGAKADITLLDLTSPHFQPTYNLLSNVVYAAGADDVVDVFVDGRHVLQNREAVTIDVERMLYEVRKIEKNLKASI